MPINIRLSADDLSWSEEKRAAVMDQIASVREYCRLDEWERKFLDSIEKQLHERGMLTEKQMSVLDGLMEY